MITQEEIKIFQENRLNELRKMKKTNFGDKYVYFQNIFGVSKYNEVKK